MVTAVAGSATQRSPARSIWPVGRVSLSLPVYSRVQQRSTLYASLNGQTPRLTLADLAALGLPGLELGDAERGRLEVDANVGSRVTSGSLRVQRKEGATVAYLLGEGVSQSDEDANEPGPETSEDHGRVAEGARKSLVDCARRTE